MKSKNFTILILFQILEGPESFEVNVLCAISPYNSFKNLSAEKESCVCATTNSHFALLCFFSS